MTRTPFPSALLSPQSLYDREIAQLQAPDRQQPLQPLPPTPAAFVAVAIKQPPFWLAYLFVWFAQIKAQFATRNITNQRTLFDYVVAALSNEYATEVRDIILNALQEDAYSMLKDLLIKRSTALEETPPTPAYHSETGRPEAYPALKEDATAHGRRGWPQP